VKAAPLALAAIGIAVPTVLTGGAFWLFALAWIGAVAVAAFLCRHTRPLAVAIPAAVACVLFAFEGGLFLLPAAISLPLTRPR
jgi:hypothetical protein